MCTSVSSCTDVYVCQRHGGKKAASCSSFQPNKVLCCSHSLLSGCPEVPLWLQGGCFVVVNWAGPGRAGVILGKACFLPLSHSVCRSILALLFLCIDISDLPREEKVWCLLLVKRERQHCPFLLSPSLWVSFVCVFSISPPDHISFNTIALAQHKLVELVLQVIVCL